MTEASESAALVLRMKHELMDLVKSEDYASALLVCEKLGGLVPNDVLVTQYRVVLGEKVALDEANQEDDDEDEDDAGAFLETADDDNADDDDEDEDDESSQEENETSSDSSDEGGVEDDKS